MPTCLQWGSQSSSACTSWGAISSCSSWGTTTRSSCASWGFFSFLCIAFTTIVEVVCVAVAAVATAMCLVWSVISTAVCLVWDLVTTISGVVFDAIEAVLGWLFSAVAAVVELIFSIPYVGRLLRWLWSTVLTVIWGVSTWIDTGLSFIGIQPQKKLRICTLILSDEKGPIAAVSDVVNLINDAILIFRNRMNIQILNSAPLQFSSGFSATGNRADGTWVQVVTGTSLPFQLDLHCGHYTAIGFAEDLSPTGSDIQLKSTSRCYFGNWRRVLGFGAPVVVLVVRSIDGGLRVGCGFGPLTDYVTIASFEGVNGTDKNQDDVPDFPGLTPISILSPANPSFLSPNNTLAHELGHICNLWHLMDDRTNLMFPDVGSQSEVSALQVALVRSSRHVSYL